MLLRDEVCVFYFFVTTTTRVRDRHKATLHISKVNLPILAPPQLAPLPVLRGVGGGGLEGGSIRRGDPETVSTLKHDCQETNP